MNLLFQPAINTGEYGDGYVGDEFDWAASELFVTTAQDSFLAAGNPVATATATLPDWANVRTLGLYTLARFRAVAAGHVDTAALRSRLVTLANTLRASMNSSAYGVVMGVQSAGLCLGEQRRRGKPGYGPSHGL